MTTQHIIGECKRCSACCVFSYWVYGESQDDLDYYVNYAKRYFKQVEFCQCSQGVYGLVLIHDIPCQHLDVENKSCKLHGTPDKPDDCQHFPFQWNPREFSDARYKDCGYLVVPK